MPFPELTLRLPAWVGEVVEPGRTCGEPRDRMRLAIELSRRNIDEGTGGPFGALVFDASGRIIAPGVNLVTSANAAVAHAEVVALTLAQQALGSYDAGAAGLPACELVTSCEPCIMCLGAVWWSGVRRLVCGARDADAREVGFDEGPKPDAWEAELRRTGVEVARDVLRDEAKAVLDEYRRRGGVVYNASRPRG